MSPRERYEAAVAALRAEGLAVTERSQPHDAGTTLHAAEVLRRGPSAEEEHALLASANRAGAEFSRWVHGDSVSCSIDVRWVEPPACAHCGGPAAGCAIEAAQ